MRKLQSQGVEFEKYDMPGLEWNGYVATIPGGRTAWFHDSEGNTMCLDQRSGG